MSDKSEAFCRQTLRVKSQSSGIVPASVQLADALQDLQQLDALRQGIGARFAGQGGAGVREVPSAG